MKFMLIMRDNGGNEAEWANVDFDTIIAEMGKFNESLIDAGVLVAADGLAPAEEGVVIDFSVTPPVVTDGPYGEVHELFNGYWILDVPSKDDAVAWALKAPLSGGVRMEIRRVPSIDEFPQDNEWIRRERAWRDSTGQL